MNRKLLMTISGSLIAAALILVLLLSSTTDAAASMLNQVATTLIPTVTGTPAGPMAVVVPGSEPSVNLRAGPNTTYDRVGVMLIGQKAPALGKSSGGLYILIEYPGVPGGTAWIWSAYVSIEPPVELPIVEPPPTPTPLVTNTIDPTLAARFIVTVAPTKLPTFTPPPPLSIPTYTTSDAAMVGQFPMGFIIAGLAVLGVFFGFISFTQRR